eukprot:CAMPEP_0201689398 /NCGR_PEP_ID=MMETSP0578-20130828/3001_1 /ASSEMBLY_ACC=CAM_ASM_000663 /TAXON_ID=267565 /ORGANISM="Skeletonema grethea, Strain CCMP 1804" /LENGTH=800 /DNA_ID=CAMNT_0048174031 /DNA_START=119 /DNA_END=2521 /DNA_ORIENTATION=+
MADDDDIFASMGGSLLNDLLSDLDNTSSDDLFTSLEKELASSYGNTTSSSSSGGGGNKVSAPPGLGSAAAFVVNQQSHHQTIAGSTSTTTTAITDPEDAWSAALGQFGGMSLAADFLAADTAKKNQQSGGQPELLQTESGMLGETISSNVVDALFEDDEEGEEYKLEEVVQVNPTKKNDGDGAALESNDDDGIDETGGLMALLGAASSRNKKKTVAEENESKNATEAEQTTGANDVLLSPKQQQQQQQPQPSINTPDKSGTMAPPPSPMFPPPFPPGAMPPPHMVHPPPNMMHPPPHPGMMMPPPPHPGMMMMPPPPNMQGGMPPPHPGLMMPPIQPPAMMMGHPPPGGPPPGVLPPAQSSSAAATKVNRKFNKDFPALGDEPEEKSQDADDSDDDEETTPAAPSSVLPSPMMQNNNNNIRIIFNNADPAAPSIPAKSVSTPLMPQRDICYIIHSMLRPLQSLDTYNDDYYHWSFVDRKSRNLLLLGGADSSGLLAQPNPVWKEVKVLAKERETKFRSAVESRAKEFAQEKQSLGRMVKTNVNRPKALLNVPVMATMDEGGDTENGLNGENVSSDKDYVLEQRRNRVQLWKARVSIDKGYSAFLSLTELRRLIQANASQPQLVNELMGDVKTNVDQMHASLGVIVRVNPDGSREMIIDEGRLSSTLSLPKGRVLCARVIEGGILPHQSACEILPVAWRAIASKPPSSTVDDGEDRLLRALTGLVLTVQPSVDPSILCRCLDATISIGNDLSNITQSRVRMELLHSILSNGKMKCAQDSDLEGVWKEKETAFMQILASQQK